MSNVEPARDSIYKDNIRTNSECRISSQSEIQMSNVVYRATGNNPYEKVRQTSEAVLE